MRTIVDIPDTHVKILDQLSKRDKVSRAETIRQALKQYIVQRSRKSEGYKSAFGLWKKKKIDGVMYQKKLRSEWD